MNGIPSGFCRVGPCIFCGDVQMYNPKTQKTCSKCSGYIFESKPCKNSPPNYCECASSYAKNKLDDEILHPKIDDS